MASNLRKWIKYGEVEIYESSDGIIVGNDHKWSVYGDKEGVRGSKIMVYPSGTVRFDQTHLFAGEYPTKNKALEVLNKMESSYRLKGVRIIEVEIKGKSIDPSFSTRQDTKGGGFVLVPKGDEVAKAHELGHIKAGHHIKGVGSGSESNFNSELEAIYYEIEELKKKGIYNGHVRNSISNNLANYDFRKSKDIKKSRAKAKKSVKGIEARLGIM
jgi:hypothetical protein